MSSASTYRNDQAGLLQGMRFVTLLGVTVLLAGIDLAVALVAQRYATAHRPAVLALGVGLSILLFLVYARALAFAELSVVTMGWIVLLQVALVLLDVRGGVHLQWRQWAAVAAVLMLQCYLVSGADSAPAKQAPIGSRV